MGCAGGKTNIVLSAGIHGFKKLPQQLKTAFLPLLSKDGVCRECLRLQCYFPPVRFLYLAHREFQDGPKHSGGLFLLGIPMCKATSSREVPAEARHVVLQMAPC